MDSSATGYKLTPCLDALKVPQPDAPLHWVALVDAGQLPGLDRQLLRRWPDGQAAALFEGTFAQTALAHSPWIIGLADDEVLRAQEIAWLDEHCADLPVLSIATLHGSPREWTTHLQRCLQLKLEDAAYLWRLADTQALQAALTAMSVRQRAWVMQGCHHWWFVTAEGQLVDARQSADPTALQDLDEPLALNAEQTAVLLSEAGPGLLAAQLRSQAEGFAERCTHAQQVVFARSCLHEARLDCIDEDGELLNFAIDRWHEQQARNARAA